MLRSIDSRHSPFTDDEKKTVAGNVYAHVWQQAMSGQFAQAA
jgi:type I restriction enzyme R subunit